MQDLRSSANYYADVLEFEGDLEYAQAHRLCAFFSLSHIGIVLCQTVFLVLVLPAACSALIEVFMGSLVLLLDLHDVAVA